MIFNYVPLKSVIDRLQEGGNPQGRQPGGNTLILECLDQP